MVSILATGMAITSETASAGAFVFAGEANGLDIITHPFGYSGVGGTIYVEVCIDSAAADARAMAQPILNIVKEINFFEASSPNLFFGADNNVPADAVDFESLTLHELGHCIGLAHPNWQRSPIYPLINVTLPRPRLVLTRLMALIAVWMD